MYCRVRRIFDRIPQESKEIQVINIRKEFSCEKLFGEKMQLSERLLLFILISRVRRILETGLK